MSALTDAFRMELYWRWCGLGGFLFFLKRSLLQVVEVWHPVAGGSGKRGSILPRFDAQLFRGELGALRPLQRRHVPAGLDLSGEGVAGLAALGLGGAAHPGVPPALHVPSTLGVARFGGGLRRVGEGGLEAQVLRRRRRRLSLIWGRGGEVKEPAEGLEWLDLGGEKIIVVIPTSLHVHPLFLLQPKDMQIGVDWWLYNDRSSECEHVSICWACNMLETPPTPCNLCILPLSKPLILSGTWGVWTNPIWHWVRGRGHHRHRADIQSHACLWTVGGSQRKPTQKNELGFKPRTSVATVLTTAPPCQPQFSQSASDDIILVQDSWSSTYLWVRVHGFLLWPITDSLSLPPSLPLPFPLSLPLSFSLSVSVPALFSLSVPVAGSLAVFPPAAVVRGGLGAPLQRQVFLSDTGDLTWQKQKTRTWLVTYWTKCYSLYVEISSHNTSQILVRFLMHPSGRTRQSTRTWWWWLVMMFYSLVSKCGITKY